MGIILPINELGAFNMSNAGRPTILNEEMATKICERLAGGESLRSVCRSNDMPAVSSVTLWVVTDRNGFSAQYREAREAAGFAHADKIINVIERLDSLETAHESDRVDPQTAKVMIDGLKWAAERMAPKSHAARQDLNHTSSDGTMTPKQSIDAGKLSTQALEELMAARES